MIKQHQALISPSRRNISKLALTSCAVALLPGCLASVSKPVEEPPRRQVDISLLGPSDILHISMALQLIAARRNDNVNATKARLAERISPTWQKEVEVMRRTGSSSAQVERISAQYFDKTLGDAVERWMSVEYVYKGKYQGGNLEADMQAYSAGALNVMIEVSPFATLDNSKSIKSDIEVVKTRQQRQIRAFTNVFEIYIANAPDTKVIIEREVNLSVRAPYDQSRLKTIIEEKVRRGGDKTLRISGYVDAIVEPSFNGFGALEFRGRKASTMREVNIS